MWPPQLSVLSAHVSAILVLLLAISMQRAASQGAWRYGQGTFYGTDAWSIHQGSCSYGYIFPDEPLGWDVVAMTDFDQDYPTSCGLCYELACNPTTVVDGYGASFDRNSACYDSTASIVVRVTDTCPCVYPTNSYSNTRWCCKSDSDPHFDISVWAFEKLAAQGLGVIGIKFRPVPCSYQPVKRAAALSNPTPGVVPSGGTGPRMVRDWPEYWPAGASPVPILSNGAMTNGWRDATYGASSVNSPSSVPGLRGGSSYCATLPPKGALSLFNSGSGGLSGRISLALWVYIGENYNHQTPPATIVVGGPAGDCYPLNLQSINPTGFAPNCQTCTEMWWRYNIPLSALAGQGLGSIINNNNFFQGCGGNTAAALNYIDLRNFNSDSMTVCLAEVLLK